ncbi:RNA-binding S4 domain-containing protein [Okibacterium fritillariae]|jgi:ribosome-associated heat shock protein Hsp15|uniref:Heat shock protein Hsp15 n=1 Tax=Okibacterium fritillariae TaxID=123320 RepID=A0A1T5JPG6_9MICO|nr:RNA-binding S4 domain-containing protein [Okibacterium fritillariae]SKC53148.1 heat shock protein Hsp15 [Okibacterium fritillariae]
MAELTSARIDAWLWAVRVFKTRSAATTACRAGHVRLNGDRAKAAALVRPGDEIRVRTGEGDRTVIVQRLLVKRVGAPVAQEAMIDRTPPPVPREERASVGERDRGAGRPTKRDRREIERLRGH